MTTVNISGTWSEKQRPNNGLERVAGLIRANRIVRVPIVGYVEYHQWTEKLTGDVLTVAMPVVEAVIADDGSDPDGRGELVLGMIDQQRKDRGIGSVNDVPPHSGEIAGQAEFDFDGPADEPTQVGEVRLTGDGPREVPPPSGEEVLAERAEEKAKGKAKPTTTPFTPDGAP